MAITIKIVRVESLTGIKPLTSDKNNGLALGDAFFTMAKQINHASNGAYQPARQRPTAPAMTL